MSDDLIEPNSVHIKEGHLTWNEQGLRNASGDFVASWHTDGRLNGRAIGDTELNSYISRYWPERAGTTAGAEASPGTAGPPVDQRLLVLGAIADLLRSGQPTVDNLTRHTSTDRSSVLRWVQELLETGYIRATDASTLASPDYIVTDLTGSGEAEVERQIGSGLDVGMMLLLPISEAELANAEKTIAWLTEARQQVDTGDELDARLREIIDLIKSTQREAQPGVTPRWKVLGALRTGLMWLLPMGGNITGWQKLLDILRNNGWLDFANEISHKLHG